MKSKSKRWIYLFAGILSILAIVLFFQNTKLNLDASNYQILENNWHIEVNGKVYEDTSLQDVSFPSASKGDVIKMSCVLPKDRLIKNPVIRLYSIHSVIEFWYNGRLYYTYGKELHKENKLLGYGYHFIHIPAAYYGAKVEITMHVTENDAFSNLTAPQICNNDVVLRDFAIQNRIPLAINMFLIVFGGLLLFVSLAFCVKYRQFVKLICVGGFSIGIGLWSLCNYELIILFTYNLQLKSYIEFTSLYISPIFVLLFFWGEEFITRYKWVKIMYYALVMAQSVFVISACLLQITGIMHFPAMLKIQHVILLLLCSIIIMLTLFDLINKKQLSKKYLLLGMAAMLTVGLCDMIHFFVIKYWEVSPYVPYTSMMCVGAMVFVLSQLVEFGREIGDIFLQGARARILEQMAYVDEMTGLSNRRRCEEVWDSLDRDSSDYGIFSFDLNFLKKTNDTKGHAKGDQLIKALAEVLSNVFGTVGEVGRIGGDEYVVFIKDMKKIDIQALTQQLDEEIKRVNREKADLNLSTAYGFCSNREYPDLDSRHIYRKADALMYEMKSSMKAERKE